MKTAHILEATLVAIIWGFAFVASKISLESFSAPQLTALRFLIAAIPALWLPRPRLSGTLLVGIGLTLFAGQFLLQFFAIANGMPPGLTAVMVQTQAFFTVLLAMLLLGERPIWRQLLGMGMAIIGLILIGLTVGGSVTFWGLFLTLASAASWGVGNILLKQLEKIDMLPLMVWLSLIPPLPALLLSFLLGDSPSLLAAVASASWLSIGATLYLGLLATVSAYAIWGKLLQTYSATMVTPFALLVPGVAALFSYWLLGEQFGVLRLSGMIAMLVALALIVLPVEQLFVRQNSGS